MQGRVLRLYLFRPPFVLPARASSRQTPHPPPPMPASTSRRILPLHCVARPSTWLPGGFLFFLRPRGRVAGLEPNGGLSRPSPDWPRSVACALLPAPSTIPDHTLIADSTVGVDVTTEPRRRSRRGRPRKPRDSDKSPEPDSATALGSRDRPEEPVLSSEPRDVGAQAMGPFKLLVGPSSKTGHVAVDQVLELLNGLGRKFQWVQLGEYCMQSLDSMQPAHISVAVFRLGSVSFKQQNLSGSNRKRLEGYLVSLSERMGHLLLDEEGRSRDLDLDDRSLCHVVSLFLIGLRHAHVTCHHEEALLRLHDSAILRLYSTSQTHTNPQDGHVPDHVTGHVAAIRPEDVTASAIFYAKILPEVVSRDSKTAQPPGAHDWDAYAVHRPVFEALVITAISCVPNFPLEALGEVLRALAVLKHRTPNTVRLVTEASKCFLKDVESIPGFSLAHLLMAYANLSPYVDRNAVNHVRSVDASATAGRSRGRWSKEVSVLLAQLGRTDRPKKYVLRGIRGNFITELIRTLLVLRLECGDDEIRTFITAAFDESKTRFNQFSPSGLVELLELYAVAVSSSLLRSPDTTYVVGLLKNILPSVPSMHISLLSRLVQALTAVPNNRHPEVTLLASSLNRRLKEMDTSMFLNLLEGYLALQLKLPDQDGRTIIQEAMTRLSCGRFEQRELCRLASHCGRLGLSPRQTSTLYVAIWEAVQDGLPHMPFRDLAYLVSGFAKAQPANRELFSTISAVARDRVRALTQGSCSDFEFDVAATESGPPVQADAASDSDPDPDSVADLDANPHSDSDPDADPDAELQLAEHPDPESDSGSPSGPGAGSPAEEIADLVRLAQSFATAYFRDAEMFQLIAGALSTRSEHFTPLSVAQIAFSFLRAGVRDKKLHASLVSKVMSFDEAQLSTLSIELVLLQADDQNLLRAIVSRASQLCKAAFRADHSDSDPDPDRSDPYGDRGPEGDLSWSKNSHQWPSSADRMAVANMLATVAQAAGHLRLEDVKFTVPLLEAAVRRASEMSGKSVIDIISALFRLDFVRGHDGVCRKVLDALWLKRDECEISMMAVVLQGLKIEAPDIVLEYAHLFGPMEELHKNPSVQYTPREPPASASSNSNANQESEPSSATQTQTQSGEQPDEADLASGASTYSNLNSNSNLNEKRRKRSAISVLLAGHYTQSSLLHKNVAAQLSEIKPGFVNEANIGGYILDLAWLEEKIAVEVDGPSHFLASGRLNGSSMMKTRHLELMGWRVLRVVFWKWTKLKGPEAKAAFLRGLLGLQE